MKELWNGQTFLSHLTFNLGPSNTALAHFSLTYDGEHFCQDFKIIFLLYLGDKST